MVPSLLTTPPAQVESALLSLVQSHRLLLVAGFAIGYWIAEDAAWRDTYAIILAGASAGFVLRLLTNHAIATGSYTVVNGDGLMLDGKLLYVVQNQSNLIAIFHLSNDLRKAAYITAINDPDLDVPTTIDRVGNRVYAVNARFGTATPSDQHYDIVKAGDG